VGAPRPPGCGAASGSAVLCQKGLPLCHERFAIGPSRDQEELLGAAPQALTIGLQNTMPTSVIRPAISPKCSIVTKVGRIVTKVGREKSVCSQKAEKTPRNFAQFLTARLCFRFPLTAKLSDNGRTTCKRRALPSASAIRLSSLCNAGS